MPTSIVPIKVKIGLRPNGHADHPAWEQLPMVAAGLTAGYTREQVDAEVRKHVVGSWHYDKQSGHAVETVDSPRGMQWGMLLVSRAFADAAVATFPALVTVMSRAECQAFWDTKAYAHMADVDFNVETLQVLKVHRDLLKDLKKADNAPEVIAVDAKIAEALDPLDPYPGVKKNLLRRWADAKDHFGVTFDPSVLP
mgnify:FL=1